MNKSKEEIRLSILGASGIGAVHARNFSKIGVKIVSILSSSRKTGVETSKRLSKLYGIDTDHYTNLSQLINESKPNAISICTPADLHYEQLCMILKKGIPVFCEKPLFWSNNILLDELNRKLDFLSSHKDKTLFVNTSNTYFIESIRDHLPKEELIKTKDPFMCHMEKFIDSCRSQKVVKNHDLFDESAFNLKLMGEILLK